MDAVKERERVRCTYYGKRLSSMLEGHVGEWHNVEAGQREWVLGEGVNSELVISMPRLSCRTDEVQTNFVLGPDQLPCGCWAFMDWKNNKAFLLVDIYQLYFTSEYSRTSLWRRFPNIS